MYLKVYKQNWVKNGLEVSEKSKFNFSYINGIGPRSRNDLDLQYSHTFLNSNSCLHLSTSRSRAAIVSEKSTVFTFSHRKAYFTKFDLVVKYVKVTPRSSFLQTMMGMSPQCYIPNFVEICPPVPEKIFEGFYHIWAWRPSWSCDLDHLYKRWFPLPKEAPHKIWL